MPQPLILIVDDDSPHRSMLRTVLRGWGYAVEEAEDGAAAVEQVKARAFDAVLTDVRMARLDGIAALREIREWNPSIPVLIMTAWSSVQNAVDALRLGAYDYLTKPLELDELKLALERALDHTRLARESQEPGRAQSEASSLLLGRSEAMRELVEMVETVAPTEATVLVSGESGTGKELVARAIQAASTRRDKPFVTINCAALAENLLESELFGHEKGAFTGADRRREGRFVQAHGGTLFLDEIGEMPLSLQAKLLRVLQQGEVQRVGCDETIKVDVRVIAATNRVLADEVAAGRFREDLFYRLNAIHIRVPPLRSRPEDIELLAQHFLDSYNRQLGKQNNGISPEAMELLKTYHWPGNVRELEHTIEAALNLTDGSRELRVEDIPAYFFSPAGASAAGSGGANARSVPNVPLREAVADYERGLIRQALQEAKGNIDRAAALLQIPRTTLYSRMSKLGLR